MAKPRIFVRSAVCVVTMALAACDVEELAFRAPSMDAVTIGEQHSCALSESGTVYCWGDGEFGQLGTGSTQSSQFAVRVSSTQRFVAVDAGGRHTCALALDGVAYCWGDNEFGQLGSGNTRRSAAPQALNTVERFRSLSAGWRHTCALTDDGRAFCWGRGAFGEIGNDDLTEVINTPAAVQTNSRFTKISAGGRHTCAIATDGFVHCWGANEVAQLGRGAESSPRPTPARVLADFVFNDVSAGWNHTCGVTPQKLGYCWGESAYGEAGTGWSNQAGVPAHPFPGQVVNYGEIMFVQISAGKHFSCGVRDQGSAYCWGKGDYGQLGTASTNNGIQPQWVRPGPGRVFMPNSDVFARVDAAGNNHACGVGTNGTVFCWGDGAVGQLGSGEVLSMVPYPVLEIR